MQPELHRAMDDESPTTSPDESESGPMAELVLAALLASLGVGAVVVGARSEGGLGDLSGPALPSVVFGLALTAPSLILAGRAITQLRGESVRPQTWSAAWPEHLRLPAKGLALLVLYVVLLEPLGYLVSTLLFAVVALHLLGWRRGRGLMGAVGLTALVYGVFSVLLKAPLPSGLLG